jgi:hypothetical protein
MRSKALIMAIGFLFLGAAYSSPSSAGSGGGVAILAFKTMFPLEAPYIGATNAIRTIPGAGAPWKIKNGSGELHVDGRLKVRTKGLVLVSTGKNPITMFQAVVSCMSIGAGPSATVANVSTDPYPADMQGDSLVNTHIDLPSPCIAPIIFVAIPASLSGAQHWIAVTGK